MAKYVDFKDSFRRFIVSHKENPDYETVKDYPQVFSTINRIAMDRAADGFTIVLMNSAISYFVLTKDIISEEDYGLRGYIDDFFICICSLKELMAYDEVLGKYLITKHWELNEDYGTYIYNKHLELTKKIGNKTVSDILSFSGLKQIGKMMDLEKHGKSYYKEKNKDLKRKINYLFYLIFRKQLNSREDRNLFESQVFATEEFEEFQKNIELLAQKNQRFESIKNNVDNFLNVDEFLKRKRIERIMNGRS